MSLREKRCSLNKQTSLQRGALWDEEGSIARQSFPSLLVCWRRVTLGCREKAGRQEKLEIQFTLLDSFHFKLVWLERSTVCA